MWADDVGSIQSFGGGVTMKKMKPLIDKTCDVCGKLISGDHVEIKTRRGTELHIHYECVRRGENDGKWSKESDPGKRTSAIEEFYQDR